MSSQMQFEPAYILHRRPYKESSFLLEVFTLSMGRMSLVAKGAGPKGGAKAAALQVFQPLLLSWSGRGDLKTLTQFEVPTSAFKLAGVALYSAYYLNELLQYLSSPADGSSDLFVAYAEALEQLDNTDPVEPILRRFELVLLSTLGALPDLAEDHLGKVIVGQHQYYLGDHGFVPTIASSNHPSNALSGHDLHVAMSLLHSPCTIEDRQVLRNLKWLTRRLLEPLLQGRRLKSREMMIEMARFRVE